MTVLRPEFDKRYVTNGEFAEALYKVVLEYDQQLSAAEVLGVLEIVKNYVLQGQKESL
jgi:hypothetical protein